MNHGRILQLGAPDDISRKPRSAFVADFIGRSNLLRGIVSAEPGRIEGIDGLKFVVSAPIELAPGAEVVLVVRPEDVVLGGSTDADNHFAGTIERRRFTGGTHLYYIRVSPNLMPHDSGRRPRSDPLRSRRTFQSLLAKQPISGPSRSGQRRRHFQRAALVKA
jgi:ABC-type Fe3+/spermidine/putrescine transport system ATPase subunit